jgi:hypothetical protein
MGHASAIVTHMSSRWTRAPLRVVWPLSVGHALCACALGEPRLAAVRPAAPRARWTSTRPATSPFPVLSRLPEQKPNRVAPLLAPSSAIDAPRRSSTLCLPPPSQNLTWAAPRLHSTLHVHQVVSIVSTHAGAEAEAASDPPRHRSPSLEHPPTSGPFQIEPLASLHHSPALSRPSSAASSPDSGHLHPCPRSGPHCEVWGLSRGWDAKPRDLFVRNQFSDLGCPGWTFEKLLKDVEKSEKYKSNFVGFLVKKPIFSRKYV